MSLNVSKEQKMFVNRRCHTKILKSLLIVSLGIVVYPTIAFAQVSSDRTLGTENSIVTPNIEINGILSDRIDGGAIRGNNLFHSLSELSVSEGGAIYFSNPPGITNIINRVTGSNPSSIMGTLGVLGNANLFLLNPNGIFFGPNSALDLKGSFVGTTANAIQFDEQGVFSASDPQIPPLLTVNPSAFIFNRLRPSAISLNSSALTVPDGKSFILLGGDLTLTKSNLDVPEGRVELGSVGGSGAVALLTVNGNELSLNFPQSLELANVTLEQASLVNTSGDRGGEIQLTGNNINLTGASSLISETSGSQKGGTIALTARDTIEVIGIPPSVGSFTSGQGDAGDIVINTKKLILREGAQITTFSFASGEGAGNGGELIVNASESVELTGRTSDNFPSSLVAVTVADGKAGNIIVTTKDLTIQKGAVINAESLGFGNIIDGQELNATGSGGNITINASNSVSILDGDYLTGIRIGTNGVGNAGNLTLNTRTLNIQNGGGITVASQAEGSAGDVVINASQSINLAGKDVFLSATGAGIKPAGNLSIKTGQMTVSDGAQVTVNNPLSQAGNLSIDADSLTVTGNKTSIIASTESGRAGNIFIRAGKSVTLNNQGEISVQADGIGKAGNLTIETGQMSVSDQAKVTVSSTEGQAGNLNIYANNVFLDRGFLTAETAETGVNGANINLSLSNLLKMQNESLISAQATGEANGGNVTINSPLLAVLLPTGPNGSDIIAKAEAGNGGNILINSQGIFGTTEGKAIARNRTNDIDASSEFGAPGRVLINNTIDPNQGTVTLPEDVVDPNTLVAQNACKRGTASQLTQTGRGGLPPTISENLNSQAIQGSLIDPAPSSVSQAENQAIATQDSSTIQNQIVPAQGWIFNQKGEVMLVAYDPTVTGSQRVKVNPLGCVVP
jgi:filamentous hemagglutinin family protein